jgi:hypothetical protein
MVKRLFRWGLLSGIAMSIFFLVTHLLYTKDFKAETWETGEILGYSSMIIALTAIFLGVKTYRDNVLGGKISFGKAFTLGLGISAVASIVFGVYVYILVTVIAPELPDKMIDAYREKIKSSGESQQVVSRELSEFEPMSKLWKNPLYQGFFSVVTIFPIGMLISLICAVILKRRTPVPV